MSRAQLMYDYPARRRRRPSASASASPSASYTGTSPGWMALYTCVFGILLVPDLVMLACVYSGMCAGTSPVTGAVAASSSDTFPHPHRSCDAARVAASLVSLLVIRILGTLLYASIAWLNKVSGREENIVDHLYQSRTCVSIKRAGILATTSIWLILMGSVLGLAWSECLRLSDDTIPDPELNLSLVIYCTLMASILSLVFCASVCAHACNACSACNGEATLPDDAIRAASSHVHVQDEYTHAQRLAILRVAVTLATLSTTIPDSARAPSPPTRRSRINAARYLYAGGVFHTGVCNSHCPICLVSVSSSPNGNDTDDDATNEHGASEWFTFPCPGQPMATLHTAHLSCALEWGRTSTSIHAPVAKCPICRHSEPASSIGDVYLSIHSSDEDAIEDV